MMSSNRKQKTMTRRSLCLTWMSQNQNYPTLCTGTRESSDRILTQRRNGATMATKKHEKTQRGIAATKSHSTPQRRDAQRK